MELVQKGTLTMRTELEYLIEQHNILRGMRDSCLQMEKKLGERAADFFKTYFQIKDGESLSLYELMAKANAYNYPEP